jgi:hypothetical protein
VWKKAILADPSSEATVTANACALLSESGVKELSIVLRMNEWLNANAPLVKRLVRSIVSKDARARFAEKKFSATIDSEHYDIVFKGSKESTSGCGSERRRTETIRNGLIDWCVKNNIGSMLDAPCGDFNWMNDVVQSANLLYTGGDIVPDLVRNNIEKNANKCSFVVFDILSDRLPSVDAWLCRDVLFHFPNSAIQGVLRRFEESEVRFFLATHFENTNTHPDIEFGRYRPVNLCRSPFNWPRPSYLIFDGDDDDTDRYLGIWENPRLKR